MSEFPGVWKTGGKEVVGRGDVHGPTHAPGTAHVPAAGRVHTARANSPHPKAPHPHSWSSAPTHRSSTRPAAALGAAPAAGCLRGDTCAPCR